MFYVLFLLFLQRTNASAGLIMLVYNNLLLLCNVILFVSINYTYVLCLIKLYCLITLYCCSLSMLVFCTVMSDLFHLDVSISFVMIKHCFLDKNMVLCLAILLLQSNNVFVSHDVCPVITFVFYHTAIFALHSLPNNIIMFFYVLCWCSVMQYVLYST